MFLQRGFHRVLLLLLFVLAKVQVLFLFLGDFVYTKLAWL